MAELAAARYLTDADVPEDVRRLWGELAIARIRERERASEARFWKRAGLDFLRYDCVMAALAFRAKRRELQAELRRCP